MKLPFIIAFLACWTTLSAASDDYLENGFPTYVDETLFLCHDNLLSLNFSNSVVIRIGQNFISSSLITCLDLRNNQIEVIQRGAFSKLHVLTNLYLSNNKFDDHSYIFHFGSHETLKVFISNDVMKMNRNGDVEISESYPNLEILSIRRNYLIDLYRKLSASETISNVTSTTLSPSPKPETPFPKLRILDLSQNVIRTTRFVDLLPHTLEKLYLAHNNLQSLRSLKKGNNVTILTLDNNYINSVIKYSNNPTSEGFWTSGLNNLRYLSLSKNKIKTIESVAFKNMPYLTYLNLSGNIISSLYPETFSYLSLLKTLDLSNNDLRDIVGFSKDINITFLSQRCNNVLKVMANAFVHTPHLKELILSENNINEINTNGFAYLHQLETLDLSNNNLSFLPEGWSNAFDSLRYLDLSGNQFTSLASLSLSSKLPLEIINLASNPLEYLDANSFHFLPQNATVTLIRNGSTTRCY